MLLYWAMFTAGFSIGAIFAYITFAPKNPQSDEITNHKEVDLTGGSFNGHTLPNPQNQPNYSPQSNQITQINTKRLSVN